ncbi:MAG: hypothetical protein LBV40_02985, partial [Methanomicrobiales archaeon]|nr:hypothetical protein [Methanomicrobiales archaeon]
VYDRRGEIIIGGIGKLYGNIDDTTTITVTGQSYYQGVAGQIYQMSGVSELYGTISGGTFTIISKGNDGHAFGVASVKEGATISGGTFTVTGGGQLVAGIMRLEEGTVSGGKFTITSNIGVFSYGVRYGFEKVSGGIFMVNGKRIYPGSGRNV